MKKFTIIIYALLTGIAGSRPSMLTQKVKMKLKVSLIPERHFVVIFYRGLLQ